MGDGGKCGLKSRPMSSPEPSGGVGKRAYGPNMDSSSDLVNITVLSNEFCILRGFLDAEPRLGAAEESCVHQG
jgi:hypothetical protein